MTSTFEQQCPLCTNSAEYVFRDSGNLKHFLCNERHDFLISRCAEKRLLKSMPQWRIALSDEARKSDEEKILVITRATNTQKQGVVAYPAINAKFMERKKLIR